MSGGAADAATENPVRNRAITMIAAAVFFIFQHPSLFFTSFGWLYSTTLRECIIYRKRAGFKTIAIKFSGEDGKSFVDWQMLSLEGRRADIFFRPVKRD